MFILLGLLVGFIAAIPIGPVNLFIVSQTLKRDRSHGMIAGVTASVLDFGFCLVALIGFKQFPFDLEPAIPYLKGLATVLLALIAVRLMRQSRTFTMMNAGRRLPNAPSRPIIGVVLLYFSNPAIYFFWFAIGGILTAHHWVIPSGWKPVVFAAACGIGALLWYFIIVPIMARQQDRLRPAVFQKILMLFGIALMGFALYTLSTIFF